MKKLTVGKHLLLSSAVVCAFVSAGQVSVAAAEHTETIQPRTVERAATDQDKQNTLKVSDQIAQEAPLKTQENISSATDSREQIVDQDPTFEQVVTPVKETEIPTTVEAGQKPGSRFSIAILPDTQFYARYTTEAEGDQFNAAYGSEPFATQTQWIADHADDYGIAMTLHVGDVVDQANKPAQWQVASEAMGILEANQEPYLIIAGNHDIGGQALENGQSPYYGYYTDVFPGERAQKNATFQGRGPNDAHEYHIFNVDGQDFLVLGLSWGAEGAELDWAEAVLKENPNTPTILVSHQLINNDTVTSQTLKTPFGEVVWDRLIAPNDQVFLTYNGHHHGASRVKRTNNFGNPVYQILTDQQMAYMGGNGYMALTEFDLTNGKIHQTTFSPWVPTKAEETRNGYDQVFLTDDGASFTFDFDFKGRFPNLVVGQPDDPSYSSQLRTYYSENYQAPQPVEQEEPSSEDDYPVVEGTVAHWRISGEDGIVVNVGDALVDITNPANNFYRAPLNEGNLGGAVLEDVTWSKDHHPLSSNAGSIRFENGSRPTADNPQHRASYFRTKDGAPINLENFENGYTFETFIKFDPNYNPDGVNNWMQWLVREGQRQNIPGYVGTEGEEPPFAWDFSNLSEVQFSFVDQQTPEATEGSAWSGEIVDLSDWYHLAAVNDPETKTLTMYVNGVPVLRNATDTVGLADDKGQPWRLGGSFYGGQGEHGFIGWIGETRLVDRPLQAKDWLTARAAKPETPGTGTGGTTGTGTTTGPAKPDQPGSKPGSEVKPGTSTKPGAGVKPGQNEGPATPTTTGDQANRKPEQGQAASQVDPGQTGSPATDQASGQTTRSETGAGQAEQTKPTVASRQTASEQVTRAKDPAKAKESSRSLASKKTASSLPQTGASAGVLGFGLSLVALGSAFSFKKRK
ncbi:metallophosphoesterase [Aerococcus sp. UMB10185]|uniref:LamG-like jellyroll fold domain-containing protein n=1 Tax=Aerococcus sp. UMB10185 TaxID=3046357 RepID=UPI00254BD4BD|nr:LamG-like jellyroll fold domain-containing protein [Aerococcus sp. UMB10185]MDK6233140.1 metallophosphoesterase [Aerococcus sp. UMB10185]